MLYFAMTPIYLHFEVEINGHINVLRFPTYTVDLTQIVSFSSLVTESLELLQDLHRHDSHKSQPDVECCRITQRYVSSSGSDVHLMSLYTCMCIYIKSLILRNSKSIML